MNSNKTPTDYPNYSCNTAVVVVVVVVVKGIFILYGKIFQLSPTTSGSKKLYGTLSYGATEGITDISIRSVMVLYENLERSKRISFQYLCIR